MINPPACSLCSSSPSSRPDVPRCSPAPAVARQSARLVLSCSCASSLVLFRRPRPHSSPFPPPLGIPPFPSFPPFAPPWSPPRLARNMLLCLRSWGARAGGLLCPLARPERKFFRSSRAALSCVSLPRCQGARVELPQGLLCRQAVQTSPDRHPRALTRPKCALTGAFC